VAQPWRANQRTISLLTLAALSLLAGLGSGGCHKPPLAPEELPPRFVFRIEFRDPCNRPVPGVQYDLYADPVMGRPERPEGQPPHEWRRRIRGQADEFGTARIDLGTDWGSLVDLYAAFAGQIAEVRASPDCFLELTNRATMEVVLDTFACARSRARMKRSDKPRVTLYARTFDNSFRRQRKVKVQCRDKLPPETPEEVEARLRKQKRL